MSSGGNGLRGKFVVLEGIDGCGKSTQAVLLADALGALRTFEPGDTSTGKHIRSIVLAAPRETGNDGSELDSRAEALLMLSDRAQHVAEVIEPALLSGRWVVCDRFAGSTLAYQGSGRGLDIELLAAMSSWATKGLNADLNILVNVSTEVAKARRLSAGSWSADSPSTGDRIEVQPDSFQDAVAAGFAMQAEREPDRWAIVDGSASVQDVASQVLKCVTERLGLPSV
ncbi:MAG TPA: dTMP kinase [Acidimicrobiales bacterium]|nr:dTMP kinase [Acidimicrobiales bacterium]